MTPAERQQRHRDKLAGLRWEAEKRAAAIRPVLEELDRRRRLVGQAARFLASMDDPARLAAMLVRSEGPMPPYATLKAAAKWLAEFTDAYRYAAALASSPVQDDAAQAPGKAAPSDQSRADLADMGS